MMLSGKGGLGVRDHERQPGEQPADVAAGGADDAKGEVGGDRCPDFVKLAGDAGG